MSWLGWLLVSTRTSHIHCCIAAVQLTAIVFAGYSPLQSHRCSTVGSTLPGVNVASFYAIPKQALANSARRPIASMDWIRKGFRSDKYGATTQINITRTLRRQVETSQRKASVAAAQPVNSTQKRQQDLGATDASGVVPLSATTQYDQLENGDPSE